MENPNRSFLLHALKNIVKTKDGYVLEKVYKEDKNGEIIETKANKNNRSFNEDIKNCYRCTHHEEDHCLLCSSLECLPGNQFVFSITVNKCDAYDPVFPLNIIKSKSDMVEFIIKVENFFTCPEDYESYFGFNRKWNEGTGDVLETVREYYARGGVFENIPEKYPCVVYFSVVDLGVIRTQNDKMNWIYIGD